MIRHDLDAQTINNLGEYSFFKYTFYVFSQYICLRICYVANLFQAFDKGSFVCVCPSYTLPPLPPPRELLFT